MTDDTETPVDIEDNLDDFENDFFNKEPAPKAEVEEVEDEVEEVDETEDNPLAPDEDDDDEAEDEEEDEEIDLTPKAKKRNRAQERIEKLVVEARTAERERDALRLELEKLRVKSQTEETPEAVTGRLPLPDDAPNPDAKDKDGNAIYDLGEFDPQYIRDLTKFTIAEESKLAKEAAQKEEYTNQMEAARNEIRETWIDNLDKAEAEIPEIRENIRAMAETFTGIDPNYGEYLAATIMSSEFGPQMMNYLSQNIGEAQKIVASGPAAATLALGRLEAHFIKPVQEEKRNTKLVSKASEPPENRTRGHGGKFAVAPDTDDLNAFEREFFKPTT